MSCFKGILNFIAELLNSNGNEYFQKEDYKRAITLYSRALIFYPKENNAKCLTNRSACYIKLKKYKSALQDSAKAMRNDERAYEQTIQCLLNLGDVFTAGYIVFTMQDCYPNNAIIDNTMNDCMNVFDFVVDSKRCFKIKNLTKAIAKINAALLISTACESAIALKGKYLSAKIIQIETSSIAYKCAFECYKDVQLQDCINYLSKVLFIDPYHEEAIELMVKTKQCQQQYELGNNFFDKQNFSQALQIINEATKIDPLNKKMQSFLHERLALINYQLLDYKQASLNATEVLKSNFDLKTLVIRAKCYFKLEKLVECRQDCNLVLKTENNDEIQTLLNQLAEKEISNSLKDSIFLAEFNFNEKRYGLSIIYCNTILRVKEIFKIRQLLVKAELELTNLNYVRTIMNQALQLYDLDKYELCMTKCDEILKIRDDEYVEILKRGALTQLCNQIIIKAKNNYEINMYKECIQNCNLVLSKTDPYILFEAYRNEANIVLSDVRNHIKEIMIQANRNFNKKLFDQCIKNCEYILKIEDSSEARNLIENSKSKKASAESEIEASNLKREALTQLCIQNLMKAKNNFENQRYKECKENCNLVLSCTDPFISFEAYRNKANIVLGYVRNHINKIMIQANRNFNNKLFDHCIKNCEYILNIEDSGQARNLLENSKSEEILKVAMDERTLRKRKYCVTEYKKKCLEECEQMLTVKEKNVRTQFLNTTRERLSKAIAQAKGKFDLEQFDQCIQECEFIILNIEKSSETIELLENAKSQKIVQTDIENRICLVRKYWKTDNFKECIEECKHILQIREKAEVRMFFNFIKTHLSETMIQANLNFDSKQFEQCIKECEYILNIEESTETRNLLKKAETEIKDTILRIQKYYETKKFKECIEECHKMLKIKETLEIRIILGNIRDFIDKTLAQANRKYELEYFDQCIEACEFILNIEESWEAANLLEQAKKEEIIKKRIREGLFNARLQYNTKLFKACIEECKQILKIKEISEAKNLIELCVTAQLAAQTKITNRLLNNANRLYEIRDYKKCLANCYKILKITEMKEARDIIQKVKIGKLNKKRLNDAMRRANEYFKKNKYEDCIFECKKVLKIEDLIEAKTLMDKAKIELQNFMKNKMNAAKMHFNKAEYKECIENCAAILKQEEIEEIMDMLLKSKSALAYEKLTDPYDVLQVPKYSDQLTIKNAYYLLSIRYHPDKHSTSTTEMRIYSEDLYKKITSAYRTLNKQSVNSK